MTSDELYMLQGAAALAGGYAIGCLMGQVPRWAAIVLLLAMFPLGLLGCELFDNLRELIK